MKFCTHCGTEIADNTEVCIKCGYSFVKKMAVVQNSKQVNNLSTVLLLVFAGIIIFSFGFEHLGNLLDWPDSLAIIYWGIQIPICLSWFLPILTIKNKPLKIITVILVIIPIIYTIVKGIRNAFHTLY